MSRRTAVPLVAAFALLLGGLQTSASAAISAWEHVNAFAGSSANKTVSVSCPAGKRALTPGAFLDLGGTNQVILDDLRPSADLTSVTAQGLEDETGTTANWFLSTSAKCAVPLPGPRASFGHERAQLEQQERQRHGPARKARPRRRRGHQRRQRPGAVRRHPPEAGLTAVTVQALRTRPASRGLGA